MMEHLLPFISFGLTILIGIISFFIKRELDNKDKELIRIDERVKNLEEKVQKQEVAQEKLAGKIDLVVEILERVEKRLEGMDHE